MGLKSKALTLYGERCVYTSTITNGRITCLRLMRQLFNIGKWKRFSINVKLNVMSEIFPTDEKKEATYERGENDRTQVAAEMSTFFVNDIGGY